MTSCECPCHHDGLCEQCCVGISDPALVSIDVLEALAERMGDMLLGHSGRDCERMLRELIGRPEQPPNPHPYGTYLWAREEFSRLRSGGVETKSASWTVIRSQHPLSAEQWDEGKFPHAAFIATDWEVVQ